MLGHVLTEKNYLRTLMKKSFNLSVVLISLDHQEEHLELKSPAITDKEGF